MTRLLRCSIALVALVLTSACNNPIAPPPPNSGRTPNPVPGTAVITVPLPDASYPMLLWADTVIPATDGQLTAGQMAVVTLACTAPSGYRYYIGGRWVVDGQPEPTPGASFGSTTGSKCDFPIGGWKFQYPVTAQTADVRALRLYVWVDKGIEITEPYPYRSRPPEVTQDVSVGWKGPSG